MNKNDLVRFSAITMAVFLILAPSSFAGKIYKWVDDTGKTHYTDAEGSIPERFRKNSDHIKTRDNKSATPSRTTKTITPSSARTPQGQGLFTARLKPKGASFFVSAIIDGSDPANLLLDTGATITIFTESAAERVGIQVPANAPKMSAVTAGGQSSITLVLIDSIEVAGAEVFDMEAGIVPDFGHKMDGLLGMSFLDNFVYQVDTSRRILTLSSRAGGDMRGGRSRQWWLKKYDYIVSNIRRFATFADMKAKGEDEKTRPELRTVIGMDPAELQKTGEFYREMFKRLERRASRAGVPMNWRKYP